MFAELITDNYNHEFNAIYMELPLKIPLKQILSIGFIIE